MDRQLIKDCFTPFTVPYMITGTLIGSFVWTMMGTHKYCPHMSDMLIIFTGPYSIFPLYGLYFGQHFKYNKNIEEE